MPLSEDEVSLGDDEFFMPEDPVEQERFKRVRTPTRCHIDLAGNTSYHFAASRTVSPRVSPYLCPGPFAHFGSRI